MRRWMGGGAVVSSKSKSQAGYYLHYEGEGDVERCLGWLRSALR